MVGIEQEDTNKKVLEYVKLQRCLRTYEGDPLSLLLENIFLNTETKPFKRTAFFGDRIVSYGRLAKVICLNFFALLLHIKIIS